MKSSWEQLRVENGSMSFTPPMQKYKFPVVSDASQVWKAISWARVLKTRLKNCWIFLIVCNFVCIGWPMTSEWSVIHLSVMVCMLYRYPIPKGHSLSFSSRGVSM